MQEDERRPLETAQSYLLKEAAEIIKSNFAKLPKGTEKKHKGVRANQILLLAETQPRSYFQKRREFSRWVQTTQSERASFFFNINK